MSYYDELTKQAWKKGSYTVDGPAPQWTSTPQMKETAGVRERVQAEIERIVAVEKEASKVVQEGRMKLAKFVKFREEKFGGVLFETKQEKVYTLNPTASAVMREIVAGSADVVGSVVSKFDGPADQIKAEVESFIAELKSKQLITE